MYIFTDCSACNGICTAEDTQGTASIQQCSMQRMQHALRRCSGSMPRSFFWHMSQTENWCIQERWSCCRMANCRPITGTGRGVQTSALLRMKMLMRAPASTPPAPLPLHRPTGIPSYPVTDDTNDTNNKQTMLCWMCNAIFTKRGTRIKVF